MAKSKRIKLGKKGKNVILIGAIALAVLIIGIFVAVKLLAKDEEITKDPVEETNTPVTPGESKLKIVDLNSTSRPYAVMINNISTARKVQSGLQDAYIVYEIIVEGGITRFMALFLDQDTARIGSIRSSRHYYLDYALENDAFYVHHGYSPQAQADFKTLNVDRIEVTELKTGWRDKELRSAGYAYEHTLFSSTEKLSNGIGSKRTKRNGSLLLNYSVDSLDLASISGAKTAKKVSIKYSNSSTSSYEYDSEAKVYKRYVNGKEHIDQGNKKQLTVKNIITYKVKNTNIPGDDKGRQNLENIGKGTGYFISEGYAVPITWQKDSRASKTIYRFENGEELKVNDGNTFIQIQPTNQSLTIS